MSEGEPNKGDSPSHRVAEKAESWPWRWVPDIFLIGCLPLVAVIVVTPLLLLR